jgi:hypothetical protein
MDGPGTKWLDAKAFGKLRHSVRELNHSPAQMRSSGISNHLQLGVRRFGTARYGCLNESNRTVPFGYCMFPFLTSILPVAVKAVLRINQPVGS